MVFIKSIVLLLIVTTLYGCGTITPTPSTPLASDNTAISETELLSTLEYIPKQKINKKGELIPYEPLDNPYLKRRSTVKKIHLALFLAAKRAYDKGNFDESEVLLQNLVTQTDKLSGPWVMLGDIALQKQQLPTAYERLTTAIAINKDNVNAYIRLAKVQRLQGNFIDAQHTYAQALSIWRDFPEAHLNLGVLYDVYLNDPIKARDHMQAYQFLTSAKNEQVDLWIKEIEQRAGLNSKNNDTIAQLNREPLPNEQ